MSAKIHSPRLAVSISLLLALVLSWPLDAQGTAFTYQGELLVAGEVFAGPLDVEFVLFDDADFGGQVGSAQMIEGVDVQSGLFEVELDFGAVFDGTALWLEVRIKDAGSPDAFTTLTPRQPLTSTPGAVYSLRAANVDTVDGQEASALQIESLELDGTVLRLTEGGALFSQDLSSLTATDADMDPNNELNTGLVLDGTDLELTDAGGTLTADLSGIPDGVDDADSDPTNEVITAAALQGAILELVENGEVTNLADLSNLLNANIELVGTELRITDGAGTLQVDLSALQDGVDDPDADPGNELNLSFVLSGTELELTDAGGTLVADLSSLAVEDADADPTNELITSAYLTNTAGLFEIVEAGVTNQVDVTPLQNAGLSFDGSNVSLTDGGGTLQADLSSLEDDADADPANELNTAFELSGTDLNLTDAGGTSTADLSGLPVEDADADPTNELIESVNLTNGNGAPSGQLSLVEAGLTNQVDVTPLQNSALGFDGTNVSLTDAGGTLQADISSLEDDADADPANELNTGFVLSGTDLELTDAGGMLTADLSSFPVEDADADSANELIDGVFLTNGASTFGVLDIVETGATNQVDVTPLQNTSLSFDGTNVSLTDGGGTLQVDITSLEDDADADPTNELNTGFVLSGTDLELTDAGGTLSADLSTLDVDDADANPLNELIGDAYLTNGNSSLHIVEAGITNQVDVTPLQNASLGFDGTNVALTDGGGTLQVDVSSLEDDADADPANELNTTFELSGTSLEVTDAGGTLSADLSALLDGSTDADSDPSNELIAGILLTGGGQLELVDAGGTNSVDLTPLQNTSIGFDGVNVTVTDGGGTSSVDVSALRDDADASTANELNTSLVVNGTDLELTDAGGTLTVDLSAAGDGVDDADADPSNELITDLFLTNGNGSASGQLSIVEGGVTNSLDVTSLQNTSFNLSGDNLQLTDGGGTLQASLSSLDDNNTSLTLSATTLSLSDAGGTLQVDLSALDGVNDLDTDPTNELIATAVLNGSVLEITEAGNLVTADLSGLTNEVSLPTILYSGFGWRDSTASAGTGSAGGDAGESKLFEIVETATSNRYEVDFNRIQPGRIITSLPITITEPGFYYLVGNLSNTTSLGDGISIDASDVTIDMMGYTLFGTQFSGISSDDGIVVRGSETNIKVYNGAVVGWGGDGINALLADFSIWKDLHVRDNGGDGLVGDFNNLMYRVTAYSNDIDGIEGDDATVMILCTAGQNGDNGIQVSGGSSIFSCASFDNGSDGFDVAVGGVLSTCSARNNTIYGFDMALGTQISKASAIGNVSNGFDMASACVMRDCMGFENGGHGVRAFANAYITGGHYDENILDGIRISSSDSHVEGNKVTDNDQVGIRVTSSGSFIVGNVAAGNATNYLITNTSAFGPIVDVTNVGDISTVTGADHPWANFAF